jgi:hypothetical protein
MLISELQEHLAKCLKDNGDIEIRLATDVDPDDGHEDNSAELGGLLVIGNDTRPLYIMLCDHSLLDHATP